MKPPAFAYTRASSLEDVLGLLTEAGEDAKLLAGGQSLIPLMAYRLARPSHLIDINAVPGLDAIESNGGGLTVGALVRHAQVEHAGLDGPWRALCEGASHIGHYPIRARGTFGGSLAHGDPASELGVVAAALDAAVVLQSNRGERVVPISDFLVGPLMTLLEPDEVLVQTRFPARQPGFHSAFEEFAPRVGDFAFASAAVACSIHDDGVAEDVRIALGSVGPHPIRATTAEKALSGTQLTNEVIVEAAAIAAAACEPVGDRHASAAFRRELVQHLVARAVRRLKEAP